MRCAKCGSEICVSYTRAREYVEVENTRLEIAVTLARDMIARLESENAELTRRCAVLAEIESVVARGGK